MIHIRELEYSCTHTSHCSPEHVLPKHRPSARDPGDMETRSPVYRSNLFHLNLPRPSSHGLEVSSHPVVSHKRDDAGRWARLGQEGVFEDFTGCGPLSGVPHQHPVQKAFEQRRDLTERRGGDGRYLLLQNKSLIGL